MFRVGAVNINGSEMSSWVEASTYTAELDGELLRLLLRFFCICVVGCIISVLFVVRGDNYI